MMARQRKNKSPIPEKSDGIRNGNSSSSAGSAPNGDSIKAPNVGNSIFSQWRAILGFICLLVALCVGYMGYLETRVNTPFDDQKMVTISGLDDPERYWGSYRPGVYFGLKTRDPYSLVTGLMWYFPRRLGPGGDGIRHWCEQGDNLASYGWIQHDGRNFGIQEIVDGKFTLKTSFIKISGERYGGSWTARISVSSKVPMQEEISLIWYTALDDRGTESFLKPSSRTGRLTGLRGHTTGLGDFSISLQNHSGNVIYESFLSTSAPGLHLLKETVTPSLRSVTDKLTKTKHIALAGELLYGPNGKVEPNFVATQITVRAPFELDVIFENVGVPNTLHGKAYTDALLNHQKNFEKRFENTFQLKSKGFSRTDIEFAQASLSNMVGGIGYFYGASRVQSEYTKEPVPYWKAPLYTAVPSRSFFPRGFLWDEGFHGLLISSWDLDIELDIIGHWFDLINVEGWIPREQILGVEALSKVPKEFVTQRNTNANPPTFFLTLHQILQNHADSLTEGTRLAHLERLFPRLQAWFNWFNTTQKGELSASYRWRGRDAKSVRELNPKTLTSGLDDYPRASHPDDLERHIDLRCWLALAAGVLTNLAQLLGRNSEKYQDTFFYLTDNDLLDELHWSPYTQSYSDYGLHTDAVILKRPKNPSRSQTSQSLEKIRVTLKNPEHRFVDSTFGYVSLFPFLLQILEPTSPKLGKILEDLQKPDLLWTDFGLRSLAKNSPLYMKRNTEHDPPYWRGQIWMNINYLAVKSLYFYGNTEGPYRSLAFDIYGKLRENLIRNIIKQYNLSGYVWEQYSDLTGEGSGCRPFTGWTALVTLIMSEKY